MKEFFVSDCVQYENKIVTSSFVVVSRQVKPKKSGEPYLALTLGDRSGHLEAKMWDNVEDAIDACNQDDFVKVKGLINKYKNRFQFTIHKLRRMGESKVDFADSPPKRQKILASCGRPWQATSQASRTLISRLWSKRLWLTRKLRKRIATPLPQR